MSTRYPPWDVVSTVRVNCKDCTAECCKHIAIPLDPPETLEDFQQIADFTQYENVSVYEDNDGDWLVEFKTRCNQLDGNRCMAFKDDRQPMTCREYSVETCVMNQPGDYWKVLFDTPEQVAAYAKARGHHVRTKREKECGRACCNHLPIPLDEPEDWRDYDDIRWYIAHRDVIVYKDGNGWFLECAARPREPCARCDKEACRRDVYEHDIVFRTWDDVEKLMREKGVVPKATLKLTTY